MDHAPPTQRSVMIAAALVFALAMALRMPSCYESLWLDELHSAWTVWADLGAVTSRAEAGHQSPVYYYGLWVWKQLAGPSELGLRLSSVLATSLSCSVLTIGVTRWSGTLASGITAGMVLAIERNAIFFGTELRPYAWIVLLASVGQVCFLFLASTRSRQEHPGWWSILLGAIAFAALLQPTSLGVLILLPFTLFVFWLRRDRAEARRFCRIDSFWLFAAAVTIVGVWRLSLADAWSQRSLWGAFGTATTPTQIIEVWDWTWLWVAPLVLATGTLIVCRPTKGCQAERQWHAVILLASVALVATGLYWLISWSGWAPLWHRRYFIAVLPTFACLSGGAVALVATATGKHASGRKQVKAIGCTLAAASLVTIGLGWQQRTLTALATYPVALAVRGENWRAAVQWINDRASKDDAIFLEPDLIESQRLNPPIAQQEANSSRPSAAEADQERLRTYLLYPVRGPYSVEQPVQLWKDRQLQTGDATRPTPVQSVTAPRQILLIRRPAHQVRKRYPSREEVIPFGNLSVVIDPR